MCFCSVTKDPSDAKPEESEQNLTSRCSRRATMMFSKVGGVHVEAGSFKCDRNGSGSGLLLTSNMSALWHLWHAAFLVHVRWHALPILTHWIFHTEMPPTFIWVSWGAEKEHQVKGRFTEWSCLPWETLSKINTEGTKVSASIKHYNWKLATFLKSQLMSGVCLFAPTESKRW